MTISCAKYTRLSTQPDFINHSSTFFKVDTEALELSVHFTNLLIVSVQHFHQEVNHCLKHKNIHNVTKERLKNNVCIDV